VSYTKDVMDLILTVAKPYTAAEEKMLTVRKKFFREGAASRR